MKDLTSYQYSKVVKKWYEESNVDFVPIDSNQPSVERYKGRSKLQKAKRKTASEKVKKRKNKVLYGWYSSATQIAIFSVNLTENFVKQLIVKSCVSCCNPT